MIRFGARARLGLALGLFFCALAVPAGLLTRKAWDQLEWEALRQSQLDAEGLATRIDERLGELVRGADARAFTDFSFLTLAGDPAAGFVQRSPLSAWPPGGDIPGLIGWFQVDDRGRLSTPLLPTAGVDVARYGVGIEELSARQALEARIGSILEQNALVGGAPAREPAPAAAPPERAAALRAAAPPAGADQSGRPAPETQAVFDRLAGDEAGQGGRQVTGSIARVDELRLEEAAGTRSRAPPATAASKAGPAEDRVQALAAELAAAAPPVPETSPAAARGGAPRLPRRERAALPATVDPSPPLPASAPPVGAAPTELRDGSRGNAGGAMASVRPIRTFESEVEPFRSGLLDSGHLVLFRNAWRDGARVIQGALIERGAFLDQLVGATFQGSAAGRAADLSVAWGDAVLAVYRGGAGATDAPVRGSAGYAGDQHIPRGTLLYRARAQDPFGELRLIFSVARLPVPPGAALILWLAGAFGLVLSLGTWLLYRLGARQLALVRQQHAFVSAVSHELKTPLTSIRMYSEMLREGWVSDARRADYYRFIHDESERLSRLLANVLQIARMGRNETRVDPRPIRLGDLLALARERIAPAIATANFELVMDTPSPPLADALLHLDPDAFVQILLNLTDNAVKFSADAPRKRIEIGCARLADGRVAIGVRDHGPGIPRRQRKRVFELFYRLDTEANHGTKGTGIGLALVRQLTRAMGGEVDLIGRDPGVEVRLRFPSRDPADT